MAESVTLCMRGHLNRENREVLWVSIFMPTLTSVDIDGAVRKRLRRKV